MKLRNRKNAKEKILIALLVFMVSFITCTGSVMANSNIDELGLVDKDSSEYKTVYGQSSTMKDEADAEQDGWGDDVAGWFEALVSPLFAGIGIGIHEGLSTGQLDLSLTRIVYGRVNSPQQMVMDVSHFGLEQNNPYGIMGSSIYLILKKISYAIVPVIIMTLLLINLFRNSKKGRIRLKEVLSNMVIYFIALEVMPYLVELYIYVRDVFMHITGTGLMNTIKNMGAAEMIGVDGDLFDTILSIFEETKLMLHAFLLIAVAFAGIIYLWDYVKIALMLTITFGLFPLIMLLMFFKPKIVADWFDIMLPNLTIPFLDCILLMAPTFLSAIFVKKLHIGNGGVQAGFAVCLILLCCVFAAKGIRDLLIRRLFNFEGNIRAGGGGLAMAAIAAMRLLTRGGHHSGGNGNDNDGGGRRESTRNADEQRERARLMDAEDRRVRGNNSVEPRRIGEETANRGNAVDTLLENEDRMNGEIGTEGELDSVNTPSDEVMTTTSLEERAEQMGIEQLPDDGMGANGEDVDLFNLQAGDSIADSIVQESDDIGGVVERADSLPVAAEITSSSSSSRSELPDDYGTLSERDQYRFANLVQMEGLEEQISANNHIIEDSGYDASSVRQQYNNEHSINESLRAHEERLRIVRDSIADTSSQQYMSANTEYSRAVAEREMSDSRLNSMQSAYNAAQSNLEYGRRLEHCRETERAYAYNSGLGGMDNRVYNNSRDFYNQRQVDNIIRRQADYRNFESGRFDNVLTPQEREAFYRQRASEQLRREVVNAVRTTGVVVGGITGAAAGMYAGGSGVSTGAMMGAGLGGSIGGVVGNGAVNSARTVRRVAESVGNEDYIVLPSTQSHNIGTPSNAPRLVNTSHTVTEGLNRHADRGRARVDNIRNDS